MNLGDIKKIGVIGAGRMGFGIALNFALWGYPVQLNDLNDRLLDIALNRIKYALNIFVEEGLIIRQQADSTIERISFSPDIVEVATTSDFITEAIVEKLEDKKKLFNNLDKLCPTHTIIVSNTSSLMLSVFGAEVKRQDKIGITHYYEPAHLVPGVELVKGPGTSEETFKIIYNLIEKVGKVPIHVLKERPGYLLNRIQAATRQEAMRAWAEGVATAETIELGIITTFGFRMPHEGPLKHYDFAGIWEWPRELRMNMVSRQISDNSQLSPETTDIIRGRLMQNKPWFNYPEGRQKAIEERDREFARRLKELYWHKGK